MAIHFYDSFGENLSNSLWGIRWDLGYLAVDQGSDVVGDGARLVTECGAPDDTGGWAQEDREMGCCPEKG
jgi:hypothetical protein